MSEKLIGSLQLAVLSALCFDPKAGAAIATLVNPSHFDSMYQDLAMRVLRYRRQYKGAPPGPTQLKDLIARSPVGKTDGGKRLRLQLLAESKTLNADYLLGRVGEFVRSQTLKTAILDASERYNEENETLVPDVEKILYDALKVRSHTIERGSFLGDPNSLRFLEQSEFTKLQIDALDNAGIGLIPKEVILYIAPKGSGKSWFCCWAGRCALMDRQKVLHISLEMSEERVIRRYYQTLFAVAQRFTKNEVLRKARLIKEKGKLVHFKTRLLKPALDFADRDIRSKLRRKMEVYGKRYGNLFVRAYPTGKLTMDMLENYLDYLAEVEGFVPHVLIVDYPDLMRVDSRNYRLDLGKVFENLRGLCVDRNMAGVFPTQGSRKTIGARIVRSTDAAEDIHKVNASDTVLAFARTKAERDLNLGRLAVEHARNNKEGFTILLAQSYGTGQYVLQSAIMDQSKKYWETVHKKRPEQAKEDEDDDPQLRDKTVSKRPKR